MESISISIRRTACLYLTTTPEPRSGAVSGVCGYWTVIIFRYKDLYSIITHPAISYTTNDSQNHDNPTPVHVRVR